MIHNFLKYTSILFFFVFSCVGYCACTKGVNVPIDISLGEVSVGRDLPIGSIIKESHFQNPAGSMYEFCDGNGGNIYGTMTYNGSVQSSVSHVYNTNIVGVGISIYYDLLGGVFMDVPASKVTGGASTNYSAVHDIIVKLYKTGNIESGTLVGGQVGYISGDDGLPSMVFSINTASKVTQTACNVTTQNLSFGIGNVTADYFTAIGTTSQENSTQNLGLNCDVGANINVTLNGTQNPDSTDPSVLALSGGTNVATGVGVQLLYNGTPLKLNNLLNLKTSAGGQETFPITARYIQTKDTVTAGSANATATLNITYQ
jgi:type 1 fimbria pilin